MKIQKFISALAAIAIALVFALQLSQTIPARGQTANNFPTIENQFTDLIAPDTAAEQSRENQTFQTEQSFSGNTIQKPGEPTNTSQIVNQQNSFGSHQPTIYKTDFGNLPDKPPANTNAHKRQNLVLRE